VIPWATLFWGFLRHQGYRSEDVSLLVGDAVVVTKAGKSTHGLERFCASLYGKPGPGLAFCTLALVRVQARRSCPLRVEHVVRRDAEQAARQAQAAAKQAKAPCAARRPGRPKGSKHPPQADGTFTPALWRMTGWLDAWLPRIAGVVSVTSLVLDGHFGNHNAWQRARQHNLPLIAKLRYDAALSVPSTGPYAGRGPHRQYGDKVDDDDLPMPYLTETTVEGHMQTCV
jgi:putative transposase